MKLRYSILLLMAFVFLSSTVDWGFFGHRRINKLACFTLPQDLFGFYKGNIDFISDHAVDPDKRRYASKFEAIRHYIDLDHWGKAPFHNIPRRWTDVMMHFTSIHSIDARGDTSVWLSRDQLPYDLKNPAMAFEFQEKEIPYAAYRKFVREEILSTYYDDDRSIDSKAMESFFGNYGISCKAKQFIAVDEFSEYGVVPYHLVWMQNRLKKAFEDKDITRILRTSAELGHYLGDAHVPLHTTENYNGQLTGQLGIHGFWESRIPELFADEEYDYFVGKASYIKNNVDYYWDIVLDSHELVDSVLLIEKELSQTFAQDLQFCYEERGTQMMKTQCREYADAYSDRMNGMVEQRMRAAILAIGNAWYSAWIDAGQPDLPGFSINKDALQDEEYLEMQKAFEEKKIKGREHN